jgi:hypothetical protein
MSSFHGKSLAFASVVGAALMTGAVSAQPAAPGPVPAANTSPATVAPVVKRKKKSHNKVTPSIVVVITNSRAVALTDLDATPSGGTPKAIVSKLAPGKKISVTVGTDKSCVFDLHGAYADGSSADSTSVDLCKDKNVNLVE